MANKVERFFDFENLGGEISRLCFGVKENKKISVLMAGPAEKIAMLPSFDRPVLYLASDYISATKIFKQLEYFYSSEVVLMPVFCDNLLYKKAQSIEPYKQQIEALFAILKSKAKVVVASIDTLICPLPKKEDFEQNIIEIKSGEEIDVNLLKKKLTSMGYKRVEIVSSSGEFSSRGDVLDVFPINYKSAKRIEFWGDTVDKIKSLNPEDLSSGEELKKIVIAPNTNLFLSEDEIEYLKDALYYIKNEADKNVNEDDSLKTSVSDCLERLELGDKSFSLNYLFPLISHKTVSLLEYLPDNTVVVIDEAKMCYDALENSFNEISVRYKDMQKRKVVLSSKNSGYFSANEILNKINKFCGIVHQKITNANRFFNPDLVLEIKSLQIGRYYHNYLELTQDLTNWKFNNFDIYLFAGSEAKAKSLSARLEANDLFFDTNNSVSILDKGQYILPLELSGGFVLPKEKKVIISTTDLYAPKKANSGVVASRKNVFSVPKKGDYVVHSFHGIGVCEGVTNLSSNFGSKDFVMVRYAGGDILYVPIDNLNCLERFSGAMEPKKLSKIGGVEFSKVKEKVKASVRKLAFDLTELYAKREAKQGFAYSKDNSLQLDFENSFNHIETEDQLKSVAEIKKDMESHKVMDRLLCGDVGFGKTEVAMRAMFKAVLDNKQVAFLAPTTILSQQHFSTLKSRLEPFGVRVEVINRFKTATQIKNILNDLSHGRIDVLCGTHRMLSSDVNFSDLGLVVLDEEQKFGVEDKEKLKNKYPLVDFLTLSATPIPRTLHMSLSGIRDISIISTPPAERLPVQTFVCEYSPSLVKDAVIREMARGGQVFILFNRVEKIYSFAKEVSDLVPDAKILVAHGQMPAKELEDTIYKFYKKEADVLICTTIIENGIDIENANTLIVCNSDMFGLSSLYQMRGRVGRGNRTAFAYFTYKFDKVLTEEAYKRLEAMSEFTEFGSGFKIAMRDLEIRGSGNILGAEQHGFMQKVGYDMYARLLSDAIKEIQGQKVEEQKDTLMRISIDAFIPESYIKEPQNRMTTYKNISAILGSEDKEDLLQDLENTFGKIPAQVLNLIDIAYAKSMAMKLKATEIVSTSSGIKIIFEKPEDITSNNGIGEALFKFKNKCALELGQTPMIKIDATQSDKENLSLILNFLETATALSYKK
ncbi:MAG: transcription-repair coupling factor [Clostridia bacterium]|nr:transcription-repair coupling factor [Clostridia bacterium]